MMKIGSLFLSLTGALALVFLLVLSVPAQAGFLSGETDFGAPANGTMTANKVFGVAQVGDTIQVSRTGAPTAILNTNVPNIITMTRAALNALDNDPDGFAVMVVGGAVDGANHANGLKRSIDEQIDFNNALRAVVDYLDANTNGDNWGNTLLIVTADHKTGALWGASGSFVQIKNNGEGNLPNAFYYSGSHTNGLVPFFAKGEGADRFQWYLLGSDPQIESMYGIDSAFNSYIDNTDIFKVMMDASPVPVPGAVWLFASGLLGLAGLRRKFQG